MSLRSSHRKSCGGRENADRARGLSAFASAL